MLLFFIVVSCLAFTADCLIVSRRYSECESAVTCVQPLTRFGNGAEVSALTDEQLLDQFCGDVGSVRSCLNQARSGCHDETVLAEVDSLVSVSEYICSEDGRQDVLVLSSSPCATDQQLRLEAERGLQACVESLTFQIQMVIIGAISSGKEFQAEDLCPFLYEFVTCSVNSVSEKCGDAFGQFIRKIVKITGEKQFGEIGCSTATIRGTRHVIDRAFPLVSRALRRRR